MRILNVETVIERIKNVHDGIVSMDISTYKNTHEKARFIDNEYGEWWAVVKSVYSGHKHPKRGAKDRESTMLKKYGYSNLFKDTDRIKKAMLKKHGITNPMQMPGIKERILKAGLHSRYKALDVGEVKKKLPSHTSIVESTYVNSRTRAVFIDSEYGKFTSIVSNVIRGSVHPIRARKSANQKLSISLSEVKNRLFQVHGDDVIICEETYTKVAARATFVDKRFGKFDALPSNVLNGDRHPKHAISKRRDCTSKYHWKTNKELLCRGSWEAKVVDFLNQHKINYQWHPKAFETPFKKKVKKGNATYTPDFYLVDNDTWVEIKGRFIDDAFEKWEWFHKAYPNSELWDGAKLKQMGIL